MLFWCAILNRKMFVILSYNNKRETQEYLEMKPERM